MGTVKHHVPLIPGYIPANKRNRPVIVSIVSIIWSLCLTLERLAAKQRSRRHLRHLTDQQLQDIGISRIDALKEASEPFWR